MPKPKAFLKESKSKKKVKSQRAPETADEFLAAGVEQEEGGEKWRAGDAAKSLRFFMRAIAIYDEGLQKHPRAFDLAYNKARLQYEITQHPKLAAQLSAPLLDALQIALQSHREALNLEQDNADALFNTAQVLTSLAEAATDTKHPSDEQLSGSIKLLQEAIELFQRCLMLQELRYTEMQEQLKQMESEYMESEHMGPPEEEMKQVQEAMEIGESDRSEPQEQWAAVIEPVTKNTLVDTAVAELDTLTTLSNLLTFNPGAGLAWIEEFSSDLLQKIPVYLQGSERQYEANLARAKFKCALSELVYRSGRIEVETYHREIMRAFGPDLDISADPDGLCSQADALTSFNTALTDLPPSHDAEAFAKSLDLRWESLSTALDALTKASKLPDASNLPKIHLARGDVEMHRWRLGLVPWEYAVSGQNSSTLLQNAQTYYRGAAALARRDGAMEETRDGTCKEAIAAALGGQKDKLEQLKVAALKELTAVAQDVVEDGLLAPVDMEALLLS